MLAEEFYAIEGSKNTEVIPVSKLRGISSCITSRNNERLKIVSAMDVSIDKATTAYDVIELMIRGEAETTDVQDLVTEGLAGRFETEETEKCEIALLSFRLSRYLRAERRLVAKTGEEHPHLQMAPQRILKIGNSFVSSSPQSAIYDNGKGELEFITYRNTTPKLNAKGRSADTVPEQSPDILIGLEYLKEIAPKGKQVTLTSSVYYLAKNNETKTKASTEAFFGTSGGNVVSISRFSEPEEGKEYASDKNLSELISDYEEGHECSGDSCKWCWRDSQCHYAPAQKHLPEKEVRSKTKSYKASLEQAAVIAFKKGIALVCAGAGAGKTATTVQNVAARIEERTKELLKENSLLSPLGAVNEAVSKVLMITFTDAGCKEMASRVKTAITEKGLACDTELAVKTFNGFANDVLMEHYQEFGYTKTPMVIDAIRKNVIVKQLLDEYNVPGLNYANFNLDLATCKGALPCAVKVFDTIKNKQIDCSSDSAEKEIIEELKRNAPTYWRYMNERSVQDLICIYENDYLPILKDANLIYYADQEPYMFKTLEMHPDLFENMGYEYIYVDEFQDSNIKQLETVKLLTETSSFRMLLVVGDDSQAIYGFRDTDVNVFLNFEELIGKKVEKFMMVENYRSTDAIISFANRLNGLNKKKVEKDLIAKRKGGAQVTVTGFHSDKDEYEWIAKKVKDLIQKGTAPEDIAFLSYTNSELYKIAKVFANEHIPYVMLNPLPVKENCRVKATISLANAFWNPEQTQSYFDYLVALYDGHLFDLTIDEISHKINRLKKVFENMNGYEIEEQRRIFNEYIKALRFPVTAVPSSDGTFIDIVSTEDAEDEIFEHFLSLLEFCEDGPTEIKYLKDFDLYGDGERIKMKQNYAGVVLTTAHSSKGLEWKYVFNSVSQYDSVYFHTGRSGKMDEIEERRRLFFVSATRAKNLLYVTGQYILKVDKKGEIKTTYYNHFLEEAMNIVNKRWDTFDHKKVALAAKKKAEAKKLSDNRKNAEFLARLASSKKAQ